MPRPLELRQAAQLMIRRHGIGAAVKAGFRAATLMDSGDAGAAAIWIDIITEINRIRAEERDAYVALPLDPPAIASEFDDRVA
jgi:hypothetical protein